MKKLIFVEFNGLPGCGKSTIANEISRLYKEEDDLKVILGEELKVFKSNKISFCIKLIAIILFKNYKFNFNVLKIFFHYCKFNVSEILSKLKYAVFLIMFNEKIRESGKKESSDIIILDQGIIQGIISLIYIDEFPPENCIYNIMRCFSGIEEKYYIINCNLDVNIAMERIMKRAGREREGRFDKLKLPQVYEGLKMQKKNFENIRLIISPLFDNKLFIDTLDNSPQKNAEIIVDTIRKNNFY